MPVRPPSLRAIAAFEAAARHQSFTKAAVELNLTTGAVSHAVRSLEERLNRRLFDRSSRKVTLTPEGQSLAIRIRLSLSLLGDAFDVSPWLNHDQLVISTLASLAQEILIPALPLLQQQLGDVEIDLRCGNNLADLDGEVDVAIRFGPGSWAGVESRFIAHERLYPVASPDYREGRLPRTIEELKDCNLIRHPASSWHLWLDPAGAQLGDFPSTLMIDDAALIVEAAANSLGVALVRDHLAQRYLRTGKLVRLFDHDVAAEYSYWALWSGSSRKQRMIAKVVDWAEQSFAEHRSPMAVGSR